MKTKTPKCRICGGPHYAYMCFKNPKRKTAIKRKYSAYKRGVKPKKDKLLRTEKNLDRRLLIMELDKYCSWIVRIKASDKNGIVSCYTCGKRLPWKVVHNGHFKSRQFDGTRFDFDNMRPQCEVCNITLHGNIEKYREKLIKEIGEERVDNLNLKKSRKISTSELKEMLEDLKAQYKELIEEKKTEALK